MIEFRFCNNCEKISEKGTKCPICGENLELKEPHFFIGKNFGKYKIEGILGQGGMGVVYLARHTILGRLSALKIIIPNLVSDADTFVERFLREAQLLAGLKHPNIVDIYDFDISEYGLPYYAMEFVEGVSLRNLLASDGKNLSIEDFGSVLKMCASALDYSHKKGIVHRDLKPENIIISVSENKPVAKILDFGIAKMLSQDSSKTLTGEGNIIGTLNYIAPEQILGGKISPKTDQYSFALIVTEIVSKRILREGKTLGEICATDIQKPLTRDCFPENSKENVIKAIQKATAKEPDFRYETVSDFVSALEIEDPEKPEKLASIIERKTIGVSPTITPQFSKDVLSQLSSKKSKTVKSAPKTAISSSTKKSKPIFIYGAIALILLLAVSTFVFLTLKKGKKEETKKEYPLCQRVGEWKIPPDASSILSSIDGLSAQLKGAKSIYFTKLADNQIPSIFPFEQNEELVGVTPNEDPLFLKSGKIVRKNYNEASEKIFFDFSKEKLNFLAVSRSSRTVALGDGKNIKFYSLFLEKPELINSLSIEMEISNIKFSKISDKYFAFLANETLYIYEISEGKKIISAPFTETVYSVFIDDVSEYAAVWGWFDRISVFSLNGGQNKEIRIKGEPKDLLILPDRPSIVVSGTFGIRFFDLMSGEILFEDSNEEKSFTSLLYCSKGVLALCPEKSAISLYSFRTSNPEKVVKICEKEIWAITKDFKSETLYLGGSDGKIYSLDKSGTVSAKELHTLGVTALATDENHLISSSDDKSIAVFKLPSLEIEYRSTAHNYLINYLQIYGNPKKLWSSSSDGSLKAWSIPDLQELFSLSVKDELKDKASLHAFWISEDEKKMLIGTWNYKLIYIDKNKPQKEFKVFRIPSNASLEIVELKKINALLICGCYQNYAVYLFDLLNENLYALPKTAPLAHIFSAAVDKDEQTAYLCPFGSILPLKFFRESDNSFSYEGSLFLIPEMDTASVMISPLKNNEIIIANSNGEVIFLNKENLKPKKMFKGKLNATLPFEVVKSKKNI